MKLNTGASATNLKLRWVQVGPEWQKWRPYCLEGPQLMGEDLYQRTTVWDDRVARHSKSFLTPVLLRCN